jgi:hypothetical protein
MKHIKDIAIIALLVVVLFQTCGRKAGHTVEKQLFHTDTVIQVGAPVTNEKYYTSIQPERVVEVHHYHDQPVDTDAVVRDYFRARYYRDSLVNDTVSYWWSAKVERNTLDTFYLKTSFKPRTRIITNSYERNRPSVGLIALYANSTPYIGAFGTWQTKRFSMSGGISPMNGGAFLFGIGLKIR